MEAKLIVVGGDAKATEIALKLPTIIGRGRGATLTLPHPLVSRQHCEIYEVDGQLHVRDMGSLNGTFVGNEPITEAPLPPGELLTVGAVTFRAIYGALLEEEQRARYEEAASRKRPDPKSTSRPTPKTLPVRGGENVASTVSNTVERTRPDPLEVDFQSVPEAPSSQEAAPKGVPLKSPPKDRGKAAVEATVWGAGAAPQPAPSAKAPTAATPHPGDIADLDEADLDEADLDEADFEVVETQQPEEDSALLAMEEIADPEDLGVKTAKDDDTADKPSPAPAALKAAPPSGDVGALDASAVDPKSPTDFPGGRPPFVAIPGAAPVTARPVAPGAGPAPMAQPVSPPFSTGSVAGPAPPSSQPQPTDEATSAEGDDELQAFLRSLK